MDVILSIDIGTTNVKAIVVEGEHIHNTFSYPVDTQQQGEEMTQDPRTILETVKTLIQSAVTEYPVETVVFSTAMHSILLLDAQYEPLTPMMLWSDQRGKQAIQELSTQSKLQHYQSTGTPMHSMSPYAKLLTLKDHLKAARVSDLKAYLMYHLTQVWVTDLSSASASGLWNVNTKTWDAEILEELGLRVAQLPSLAEIDVAFAATLDNSRIRIVIGSTDGVFANRGIRKHADDVILSVGTSVGIRRIRQEKQLHPQGLGFCYYAGMDSWLIGNASNNGGNLLSWIHETYSLEYEAILNILQGPLAASFVTPYLFGERGPWWQEDMTVVTLKNKPETLKDTVQSLVFAMFSNIELLIESMDFQGLDIRVTGGFFKDPRMLKLFASYLNQPLYYIEDENAVCMGGVSILVKRPLKHAYQRCEVEPRPDFQAYKRESKHLIQSHSQLKTGE